MESSHRDTKHQGGHATSPAARGASQISLLSEDALDEEGLGKDLIMVEMDVYFWPAVAGNRPTEKIEQRNPPHPVATQGIWWLGITALYIDRHGCCTS